MQFNLYATYRLLAKTKTICLDLPEGTTVHQAVNALLQAHPVLRPHWVDKVGELHAHVHIFLNGHDLQTLDLGLETPLKAEDALDFIPPVGGG